MGGNGATFFVHKKFSLFYRMGGKEEKHHPLSQTLVALLLKMSLL
jgi:hypothetical protein